MPLLPWWMFDIAIVLFFLGSGWLLWHMRSKHPWRRHYAWVVGLVIAGVCLVAWGSFVEPLRLVTQETAIDLVDEPDTYLRAVVFSDLHVGPYKQDGWVQRVVERVNGFNPDIILIPGDFLSLGTEDVQWLEPLKDLQAPLGVYAVTGNHDFTDEAQIPLQTYLESIGWNVLKNTHETIEVKGQSLVVAGMDDYWFTGDVEESLRGLSVEDTVLFLAHNPDAILETGPYADLTFSGHTHGGQIRLPIIGPVPPLPTKLGRDIDQGWFTIEGRELFITSGLGETGPRARLFNPPEVVLVTIGI